MTVRIRCEHCRQRPRVVHGHWLSYEVYCECNEDYDAPSVGAANSVRKALVDWAFNTNQSEYVYLRLEGWKYV